jgi:hypothetical protein
MPPINCFYHNINNTSILLIAIYKTTTYNYKSFNIKVRLIYIMTLESISSHLPQSVQKFVEHKSKWIEGLKDVKDADLFSSIDTVLDKADFKESTKPACFIGRVIQELGIRKLSSKEDSKLESLKNKVKKVAKCCLVDGVNVPEVAGITINKKNSHVYGQKIKEHYAKWEESKTSKDFDDYLKEKLSSKEFKALKKSIVKYLNPHAAKKYAIIFDKNGYVQQNGKTLEDGVHMFSLNLNATKLYAGKKEKGRFHHSSFTSGDPVQCAGNFIIKNGKLAAAKLESGHYRPNSAAGKRLRKYLSDDSRLGKAQAKEFLILNHKQKS